MMRNAAKKTNFQTNNLVNMKDKIQLTVQLMTFAPPEFTSWWISLQKSKEF